jgi:hypothetical protein
MHLRIPQARAAVELAVSLDIAAEAGSSRCLRFRAEAAAKTGCGGRRSKTQIDQNGYSAKFAVLHNTAQTAMMRSVEGKAMRRRSRTAPERAKSRRRTTTKPKRRKKTTAARHIRSSAADLQKRLDRKTRELDEALAQQTATSGILGVIARSAADIQPLLDALCQRTAQLCEAYDATIWRPDGGRVVPVAHYGPITQIESLPLIRGVVAGRTILDKQTLHIADVHVEADEFPETSKLARRLNFRTVLSVPLMREGVVIGTIALRRTETRLFTERQVALLQTFADQAIIAIENARLLKCATAQRAAAAH